jgi:hypothetical protein
VAERITALLEEGKAGGEFDPAIPTDVMASIFSACSHRGPTSTW